MERRTRRWLIALACIGGIVGLAVGLGNVEPRAVGLDPTVPEACDALFGQAVLETPPRKPDDTAEPIRPVVAAAAAVLRDAKQDAEARACAQTVLAHRTGTTEHDLRRLHVASLDSRCREAAALARHGQIEDARARYEDALRNGPVHCALGGEARLPDRLSVLDWIRARSNRLAEWLTGWLPGGPIVLTGASSAVPALLLLLVVALLALGASRQIRRWAAERWPGPVDVVVDPSDTEGVLVAAAGQLRDCLSTAGLPLSIGSAPLSVGAVAVTVVDAVDPKGGKWFQSLYGVLKGALVLPTGYTVTIAVEDRDAHQLRAKLEERATGRVVSWHRYGGSSWADAASGAAFDIYLQLMASPEVWRRTPSSLGWQSAGGLSHHQAGVAHADDGRWAEAVAAFEDAAGAEPGNELVQVALCDALYALAGSDAAPPSQKPALLRRSMVAALRVATLHPGSSAGHARVALLADSASRWLPGWDTTFDKVLIWRLLEHRPRGAPALPAPGAEPTELERWFRDEAYWRWRVATRRTWWIRAVAEAWRLERRRSVRGLLPFSHRRAARHDALLANVVADWYRKETLHLDGYRWLGRRTGPRSWWARRGLAVVRFGRLYGLRRSDDQEVLVQYNLGCAYAMRATWLAQAAERPRVARRVAKTRERAVRCLERSMSSGLSVTSGWPPTEVDLDADLALVVPTAAYERWRARFAR